MERRTELKRSAIERSTTPMDRGKPMARKAMKKKAAPTVDAMVRRRVRARSRGICEAATEVCTGTAVHQHHKQGRGAQLNNASLILDVCRECHDYIHAHPTESYEHGWLIKRNGVES